MALLQVHKDWIARSTFKTHEDATASVMGFVRTYNPTAEEIREYLDETFRHFGNQRWEEGRKEGREEERNTNPALKAFGATIAEARKRDMDATFALMRDVFDGIVQRGGNAIFAFYEALEAAGKPREREAHVKRYRLPSGRRTDNAVYYSRAWRAVARPIERATGAKAFGFDPDIAFSLPGGRTFSLPLDVAKALGKPRDKRT